MSVGNLQTNEPSEIGDLDYVQIPVENSAPKKNYDRRIELSNAKTLRPYLKAQR